VIGPLGTGDEPALHLEPVRQLHLLPGKLARDAADLRVRASGDLAGGRTIDEVSGLMTR
jgi:hypothetical protein